MSKLWSEKEFSEAWRKTRTELDGLGYELRRFLDQAEQAVVTARHEAEEAKEEAERVTDDGNYKRWRNHFVTRLHVYTRRAEEYRDAAEKLRDLCKNKKTVPTEKVLALLDRFGLPDTGGNGEEVWDKWLAESNLEFQTWHFRITDRK